MPQSFKELAAKHLAKAELEHLRTSFDVVGDIAIMEIPPELEAKQRAIGEALLMAQKNIKVVCKKHSAHAGEFRTRKLRIIAGQRRKTTVYTESGCRFRLHLEKTYFSVRFGTERLRIARLVRPGERILVMFSGIAPFPIVIARNAKPAYVLGVEKNAEAHRFGMENVSLNKVKNVELRCGDVRRVLPGIKENFDRVIMPLPRGGQDFLELAIHKTRPGGMLHFYDFLHEDELAKAQEKVEAASKRLNRKFSFVSITKCGQFGPRVYRVCVDCKV